ncbi:hypothetical protein GSH19_05400 [Lactobacillus sp. S2-2]|uniref:heavy-metal-associated domain-containing protein n=1 Tax=Lactobacillus sp. S2-2 TaxID=2692917 RepID=UPI001F1F7907|nr:cation transporter [Lactobacillus sp. S2-2]MCF6515588.1 hypothetical protein [Lactobacillus sp. S2-2]
MKNYSLQLETITCPSCLQKIEKTVSDQAGVSDAEVLFNASKVNLKLDETKNSVDQIKAAIQKLGFEVQSVA